MALITYAQPYLNIITDAQPCLNLLTDAQPCLNLIKVGPIQSQSNLIQIN